MATSSDVAQDTAVEGESASDGRVAVIIRLPPELYRDMRLAMAQADIRTNQEFGEQAIAHKTLMVLRKGRQKGRKGDVAA